MSKRLYSTGKWKRRIRAAQARELAKKWHRKSVPGLQRPADFIYRLVSPGVFSLLDNPAETVDFLNLIELRSKTHKVFIDFDDVEIVTPEAPLALVATMRKGRPHAISGSNPKKPGPQSVLRESGFFKHVRQRGDVDLDASSRGAFFKYAGQTVDAEIAAATVKHGCDQISLTREQTESSFCILVEGMTNTREHARNTPLHLARTLHGEETEYWWVFVYADLDRNRVCFALLDLGVGILGSAKIRFLRRIDRQVRKTADAEIIENMFAGEHESRTELPYRGKGLPKMRNLSVSGSIKSLTLLSNGVLARVNEDSYSALPVSFGGTMLYWECQGGTDRDLNSE